MEKIVMEVTCIKKQPERSYLVSLLLIVFLLLGNNGVLYSQSHPAPENNAIPLLDDLAGNWQNAADLLSLPAINNTQGSAQVARDVLSVKSLSFPPITLSGETGALLIDGVAPDLQQTRWYPYQVLRKGAAGNLGVETSVRMDYEQKGLLFHVVVTNNGSSAKKFKLAINLSANTSRYSRWGWAVPKKKNLNFSATPIDKDAALLIQDSSARLSNCFSFERKPGKLAYSRDSGSAAWNVKLRSKDTLVINYVLYIGEENQTVLDLAKASSAHFDQAFSKVKSDWQQRFNTMFTPGNHFFSGHLPVLETSDKDLKRMYYMSAVSVLSVLRTGFPEAPRVYVSNTPESNCTMMYFWDTSEFAESLALLDPVMLKRYLQSWLKKGIYNGYSEEYLTGTLQGPWYSANDLSVFRLINAYLNVTKDTAFLSEKINDKTVLEHMGIIANNWKLLVRPGRTLADYGEARNLLECVPTYIHEVPSFNAANINMMRRVAAIEEHAGNKAQASKLQADANSLLPLVMALYEPGQGIWNALHRDGKKVQIRHVWDFATIGLTIKDDLSADMRKEMVGFVEKELLTDKWMRAQSLSDIAASVSNRPDHGPMGAYSAWPAQTIRVMCGFGDFSKALDFLQRCASVTYEGPFPQSVKLMDKTPGSVTHTSPGPQTFNASNGGSFAETIIRGFFGYEPDFLNNSLVPDRRSRGFRGSLMNVRSGNSIFNIISDDQGLKVTEPEKP